MKLQIVYRLIGGNALSYLKMTENSEGINIRGRNI